MRPDQIGAAVALAEAVPLTIHPRSDLAHVVELPGRLERKSVYDAVYVALADSLGPRSWPWTARSIATRAPGGCQ